MYLYLVLVRKYRLFFSLKHQHYRCNAMPNRLCPDRHDDFMRSCRRTAPMEQGNGSSQAGGFDASWCVSTPRRRIAVCGEGVLRRPPDAEGLRRGRGER
ncbi:hypothetical protein BURCENBC7_AP4979 [Burkholderia cenocepacia BC7]|nr:hypothetical protein BURCENBC7_AP4979 [Burkholderia cenocepacia BC7]